MKEGQENVLQAYIAPVEAHDRLEKDERGARKRFTSLYCPGGGGMTG